MKVIKTQLIRNKIILNQQPKEKTLILVGRQKMLILPSTEPIYASTDGKTYYWFSPLEDIYYKKELETKYNSNKPKYNRGKHINKPSNKNWLLRD